MSERSHPAATRILGGVALLHNFCFWGLASMFPLYATSRLEFSQARATLMYGLMLGVALAMPALGGLVVSRLRPAAAPQQRVRIAQAALLCLGSAPLFFLFASPNFTVVGGVLLALGNGLFLAHGRHHGQRRIQCWRNLDLPEQQTRRRFCDLLRRVDHRDVCDAGASRFGGGPSRLDRFLSDVGAGGCGGGLGARASDTACCRCSQRE